MTTTAFRKTTFLTLLAALIGILLAVLIPIPCNAAALPPVITSQPASQTNSVLGTANFQVTVTSLSTLSYQWRKNGADLSGATTSSYTVTNLQPGDAGSYAVKVSNAGGTVNSSNATLTVLPNTAPVLDPAKHPVMVNEYENTGDPSGTVGTLVSHLVDFAIPAGQVDNVTDADAGALLGIAVTTADASQGSWWYSINGGTQWSALGAVSDLSARLLAADASTRIYFKPNTNWIGVLSNAFTFRAWDQTAGNNGATAVARFSGNMMDTFSATAYGNSDGSDSWSGNWVDIDGSPSSGSIGIQGGQLVLTANNATDWIYREANLSGVSNAMLSFDYNSSLNGGNGGLINFQVSSNGGASYAILAAFSRSNLYGAGSYSADITSYASANTRMRFQIAGSSSAGKQLLVDNFQVVFTSSSVGGSGAFSLAKESASLTVLAMNNPPVASNQSITTPGGAPSVITLTGSDTENSPLIFSVLSGPTNGVLSAINATNGTLTYTPKSGYAGPDSFTFAANDGLTNSSAALVSITVTPVAPTILTQPISQTVMAGQSAVFSVAAAGTAPMGYQWKRNGSPVAGATNSALLLNPVQMTDAGTYAVVVSNLAGSATSAAAALTVVPPPTLGAAAMTSNGFRFQLSATVGYTYVTLASTNLHDWSPIATNVATSNSVVVTDPLATRCAGRFYRVARTN